MTLKTAARTAAHSIKKALAPEPHQTKDTDLLDTLKLEHDQVKTLLSDLQDTPGAAQRKALVKRIKLALVPHTKAEQKILYDAIVALKDKHAQMDGYEGHIEHELASRTLQKLGAIVNATSPEHKAAAKVLKELVEHHIEEEESNVWADAKEHFSDDERRRMNVAYLATKARVTVP